MDFLQVFLDKDRPQPLYQQLYETLAGAIRSGRLPSGERLPGKRAAAAQLGVSVNTVNEAYQQLAAEGYVAARPRSGFVVSRLEALVPPPGPETPAGTGGPEAAQAGPLAEAEKGHWRYSFSTGGLDVELFPLKMWNRLLREVMAEGPALLQRGDAGGEGVLREAVAEYLRGYRGVRCEAAQVVMGAGLEVLCSMLARLLKGHTLAMEEPGYPKVWHLFGNMGLPACQVAVDGDGMEPTALEESGATTAYVTPSHQFPTGAVMPVGRRTELLRWATGDRYIIEDDYDSEFRFDGRPLPSLQGLDEGGRVIYAGTFSRSLAPGIRAAYLVLPPALLARWKAAYGDYACTVWRPEQHTLARFMKEGHFARSLNRVRGVYRTRRDAVLAGLKAALGTTPWRAENTHTGLYFVLRLPGQNAGEIALRARQAGIRVHALDEYRRNALPGSGALPGDALVLGYGGLAEREIEPALSALAKIILNKHHK